MKRLAFISLNDHVKWGGSEELWYQTALDLSSEYAIFVFIKSWNKESDKMNKLRKEGIKVLYKNSFKQEKLTSKVKRKLRGEKFHPLSNLRSIKPLDIVILSVGNHSDQNLPNYCEFLRKEKIPYAILVQLATDLRNLNDPFIDRLKESYINAKKVFFLSVENKKKTEMQLALHIKNYSFVNNPFNFKQDYTKYLESLDDKVFTLALVGALTAFHKGQDILISVLSQNKWKQRPIHVNLYGSGENHKNLNDLIALLEIGDKISLKGFEANKEKIWQDNMACILPSRMEGQSLAMLEAMSHGRMVIATNVGGANELIEDGENGFLIPAPTFDLLDHTLERAWGHREEWIEMGKKSRLKLEKEVGSNPVTEFSSKLIKII